MSEISKTRYFHLKLTQERIERMFHLNSRMMRYFIALCEEMNYNLAADRLGISQPSLSYNIHSLEKELNVKLFTTIKQRIHLTKQGEFFLEYCYHIMHQLEEAKTKIQYINEDEKKNLRIGTSGLYLVSTALEETVHEHPSLNFSIEASAPCKIADMIRSEEIDIGIVHGDHFGKGIDEHFLFHDEWVLVSQESNELGNKKQVTFDSLHQQKLIVSKKEDSIREQLEKMFREHKKIFSPFIEVASLEQCIFLVKQGLGVSVLPKSFVEQQPFDGLQMTKLDILPPQSVSIIYQTNASLEQPASDFKENLSTHYKTKAKKRKFNTI